MPTKFGDLSKPINDLFNDDFGTETSVKVTTKSANGITLVCKGKNSSKGTSGELETSLNWIGLDFKETWKTDGTVTSEVSKKGFVEAKASKAVTEVVISPTDGLKKVTIKANVEVGDIHADVKTSGADIPKSLDVGFVYSFLGNWSLGFQASSKDILASNPKINKTIAGLYESDAKDLTIYSEVALDDNALSGKVYHIPSATTKFGAKIESKGGSTALAAVGQYKLDDLTTLKASLDSGLSLNLSSTHKVGATTITPSAVLKLNDSAAPGFGIAIKMAN